MTNITPNRSARTDALKSIRIILVRTSHPGNVGQVARAMANMGLVELYITSPRFPDMCAQPDAIALASGATDVLEQAVIVPDLATALQGVNCAFAFSARTRDLAPPLRNSGEAAAEVMALFEQAAIEGKTQPKVAFVFGAERSGLVNDEVMLCQRLCQIQANPDYNSLNLAQAVQVMTYSLRQAALNGAFPNDLCDHSSSNSHAGVLLDAVDLAQLDGMLGHWQAMLTDIGMINPDIPTETMARLRALFSRTQLTTNEVNFLRGVASAVQQLKKQC